MEDYRHRWTKIDQEIKVTEETLLSNWNNILMFWFYLASGNEEHQVILKTET